MRSTTHYFRHSLLILSCMLTPLAMATEMVYYPYNPSFGGSPLNGPGFLNSALATNKHKPPDVTSDRFGIEDTPLENFRASLERSILSRLASAATSKMFDPQGNFVPGTYDTENFTITIADIGDNVLTITTMDKSTGGTTIFQVGQ